MKLDNLVDDIVRTIDTSQYIVDDDLHKKIKNKILYYRTKWLKQYKYKKI